MKKIFIILLCLLVGGLVWHLWPEYGSGYSEEQRRLWNERRSLYPVVWMLNGGEPRQQIGSYDGIAKMTGKTQKEVTVLVNEKKRLAEELSRKLEENRDKSGPDCLVAELLSVDTSRLPLYGLTQKEIAERALAGDGDACLKMVQYMCRQTSDQGIITLSWKEKHEAEKWLDRAVTLKRPGAGFLKNLFAEAWAFQKSRIGADGEVRGDEKLGMEKTPGYSDFVECLKAGDYFVYRTVAAMLPPSDTLRGREMIHKALLKGARQGKAENQRDYALLFFEEGIFRDWNLFPYRGIDQDIMIKKVKWVKWLKWVSASWQKEIVDVLFACGVLDAGRTPTMEGYREASKYAREAALQGDLTGMYLWIRYGITCQSRFSTKEWNDIFSYGRVLLAAGYTPYIEEIKEKQWGRGPLDNVIARSYYSKKSYETLWKKDYLESRDIKDNFPPKASLEEVRERVQDFSLIGNTDRFLEGSLIGWGGCLGGLMVESSQEVKEYLLEQVEKWAEEGDLHAMYRLAVIYEKGIGVPTDPGRAYAWYGKALEGADECPKFSVSLPDSNGSNSVYEMKRLKHVARLKRAEMVLNYPDFPGRDEKETYDLVLESSRDFWLKDYCYPILGQFHEKGIGRPVDRKRAIEFYTKGKSGSKACRAALDRLSTSEGAQKTEKNRINEHYL